MANPMRIALATGLLFGAIAVYVALTGLLLALHGRWIVEQWLSLSHALLAALGIGAGLVASRRLVGWRAIAASMLAGTVAAALVAGLAWLMHAIDLRPLFIALSAPLQDLITFDAGLGTGVPMLLGGGLLCGTLGGLWLRTAQRPWHLPIKTGTLAVLAAGLFQQLGQATLLNQASMDGLREFLYSGDGLSVGGAIAIFLLAAGSTAAGSFANRRWPRQLQAQGPVRRGLRLAGILLVLVALPLIGGPYVSQVMLIVALYALMGMGLNLEYGLAGLLDLGFVAFFAIGAYACALLSADSPLALAQLSFWVAMPVAVLAAALVGVLFGLPVLGVRGDYLAVATLGLGEIVRILVTSDIARPVLGGAQGILGIPRPAVAGHALNGPVALYFLTLAATLLAAFVALRLAHSKLGRAWRALRDDEEVAQALGVDLVRAKLLAYGLGAAFAGLAGAIFAAMVSAIYPSSFQLLVSINVLALIVVGGTGSLPGIVLGAMVLVGLPELLREFGEYRFLLYGAALVYMMRRHPAGLWPVHAVHHERSPGLVGERR